MNSAQPNDRVRHAGPQLDLTDFEASSPCLAEEIERQRTWLAKRNLVSRPWMIFGSAPSPVVPAELLRTHARVDINNAGKTAQKLGFGRAALTYRSHKKSWEEHSEVDTEAMIWLRYKPSRFFSRRYLLPKPYKHIGKLAVLTGRSRNDIVRLATGTSVADIGDLGKVSNGVSAACHALFFGVPEIVLTGISLTELGHSYDELGRQRRHAEEDTFLLRHLADRPELATTDADLSRLTGIRLWAPKGP